MEVEVENRRPGTAVFFGNAFDTCHDENHNTALAARDRISATDETISSRVEICAMNLPSSKLISDPRTESEEHYRLLVENLGEGVAYVDPNEIFTFANPAAESILGVGPGELVGRCLLDFLAAEVHPLIHKEAALRRTNVKSRYEHEIVRP